ncbi:GtrA family protein [Pseudoduganella violaceinigra]|uniref:GtrA family protein n=1 Tax=Pseudoduganella violaceinigra TaxID=246602 RepID=UPI00040EA096|nr:GtrA family protein [Pseudoduganella violaceinigra]
MLKKLLGAPSANGLIQLLRYMFVGGMAFVVDYGALFLLAHFAGMHYLLAASLSYLLGMVCNYLVSVNWVFDFRRETQWQREFIIFFLVGIAGLILNGLAISLLVEGCGLSYMVAKLVAAAVILFFNFGARKALLFSAAGTQAG